LTQVQTIDLAIHEKIQLLKKKITEAVDEALENPTEKTIDNLENILAESKAFRASLKEA
jgi:hypothetical protein